MYINTFITPPLQKICLDLRLWQICNGLFMGKLKNAVTTFIIIISWTNNLLHSYEILWYEGSKYTHKTKIDLLIDLELRPFRFFSQIVWNCSVSSYLDLCDFYFYSDRRNVVFVFTLTYALTRMALLGMMVTWHPILFTKLNSVQM